VKVRWLTTSYRKQENAKKNAKAVLKRFCQLANNAPLWFYIFREAEQIQRNGINDPDGDGHHLDLVSGRVVAEVEFKADELSARTGVSAGKDGNGGRSFGVDAL
jgi:hypothetical protein